MGRVLVTGSLTSAASTLQNKAGEGAAPKVLVVDQDTDGHADERVDGGDRGQARGQRDIRSHPAPARR